MNGFALTGFLHLPSLLPNEAVARVAALFSEASAGERISIESLRGLELDEVRACVAGKLGAAARPVRAILFDKQPGVNWALGWHQDRTIHVRERRQVPGFGPWTVKQGLLHVAPPISVLARMLTVRVHVDPVDLDNAPLLVAPGSHRRGVIREAEIHNVVGQCGVHACLAEPVTFGSTPPPSSMPRHARPVPGAGAYCRWTFRQMRFPTALNGALDKACRSVSLERSTGRH